MTELSSLIAGAGSALLNVLELTSADRVVVVTDAETQRVGEAFHAAAAGHGCLAHLYTIPEAVRPLREVPPALESLLPEATVVVNAFAGRGEETPFRVQWLRRIEATGRIRCGHSPGITEAMFDRGPLDVDYAAMRAGAERLIAAFAGAIAVRITTPAGSDLTLGLFGRAFRHDCRGSTEIMVNLPCGEIYCAPVETDGEGVLVADGAIGPLGAPRRPVRIHVRDGRIARVSCDDADLLGEVARLTSVDAEASVVGELGIGINPGARIVGRMLEDEKAFRTAHVAFGNNEDMPGGRNRSRTHNDFLVHRPTCAVTYTDGTTRTLIEDGDVAI